MHCRKKGQGRRPQSEAMRLSCRCFQQTAATAPAASLVGQACEAARRMWRDVTLRAAPRLTLGISSLDTGTSSLPDRTDAMLLWIVDGRSSRRVSRALEARLRP
jgi:hypothetical protein